MRQIVYTTVRWVRCGKMSAVSFTRSELAAFLVEQVPIEPTCAYDL